MSLDPLESEHNGGGRRWFVTTTADVAALSRLLKATFPGVVFFTETESKDENVPPQVHIWEHIQAADSAPVYVKFLEPGWRPQFAKGYDPTSRSPWYWYMTNVHGVTLKLRPSDPPCNKPHHRYPDPPWNIYPGDFMVSLNVRNPEHARMKAKLYRLMGKVATNRMRLVEWPSMRDLGKGLPLWVGFDALRWQREAPGRVFWFEALANGEVTAYVPAD